MMILIICILQFLIANRYETSAEPVNVALNKPISAQFTCGKFGREYYNILSDVTVPSYSRHPLRCEDLTASADESKASHPSKWIVDGDLKTSWVSASRIKIMSKANLTAVQHVQTLDAIIRVDLLQEFMVDNITINLGLGLTPQKIAIFRSQNGQDYLPWIYKVMYSTDCEQFFRLKEKSIPDYFTDVICSDFVGDNLPPGDTITADLSSIPANLREWKRARHIRLEFYDMKMTVFDFAGDSFNHYDVAEVDILAECPCNGQEIGCEVDNVTGTYQCVCGGNTKGRYCETCQDFYNQFHFLYGQPCKACYCHNHSSVCYYNSSVAANNQSLNADRVRAGGGVCLDCQHNTAGVNCERCANYYFRPLSRQQDAEDACQLCNCSAVGSTHNPASGLVDCVMTDVTAVLGKMPGDCFCKEHVQGSKCDACAPGFYNLRPENPLGCQPCLCHTNGTIGGSDVCNPDELGQCLCKTYVEGRQCDVCKDGYFDLQNSSSQGCSMCDCDPGGALSGVCNKQNGQCTCRNARIIETKCDRSQSGFYYPDLHAISAEAESSRNADWSTGQERSGFSGFGFVILHGQMLTVQIEFPGVTHFSGNCVILLRYQSDNVTTTSIDVTSSGSNLTELTLPPCDQWCYVSTKDSRNYTLVPGPNTVTINSTGTLYLDRIIAIPVEYLQSQTFLGNRYYNECDVISNNMRIGTPLEEKCLRNVFSLAMYYWGRPSACACDPDGSNSSVCMEFGGQCLCKPGVGGRKCDQCLPGFYHLADVGCQACQCPSADQRCNDVTGQCLCPPNTIGRQCELCAIYHYGLDMDKGCKPCDCDTVGSISLQCNATSGECFCKAGIGGARCDQCLDSFVNFSTTGCKSCGCDTVGSVDNVCNKTTGQCNCKEFTSGPKCGSCVASAFYLSENQDGGCLNCVCMGVSSECSSSNVRLQRTRAVLAATDERGLQPLLKLANSTGWESTLQPSVVTESVSGVTRLEADFDGTIVYFWKMPTPLTGNLLPLYGSIISVGVGCSTATSGGLSRSLAAVLIGGHDVTYVRPLGQVSQNSTQTIRIPLSEDGWIHQGSERISSRGQFLLALTSIRSILVQAVLWTGNHTSSLSSLEYSKVSSVGQRAMSVEECICAPEYTGLSCQECAPGYKRTNVSNHEYLGLCTSCECNNHSSTCDPDTGACTACQGHTIGFGCEMCESGYYGNATRGLDDDCKLCPCTEPRVMNGTCSQDLQSGAVRCLFCENGYIGDLCDRCADFYYGDPQDVVSGRCTECNCNGNAEMCNNSTGICIDCRNNTMGDNCERCIQGYYGNASFQACTECRCNMSGSTSTICDHVTGQCPCQPGVGNRICDACLQNFWGYNDNSSVGCQACDCVEAGSISQQCDGSDGHCTCKPNTQGNKCDMCQPGFFGLPLHACQICDCNATGSVAGDSLCNRTTGQCNCKFGVGGRACDACKPLYTDFGPNGCTACGQCQLSLGSDIQNLAVKVSSDVAFIESVTSLQAQDARLQSLHSQLNRTLGDLGMSGDNLTSLTSSLIELAETERLNRPKVNDLEIQASDLATKIDLLLSTARFQTTRLADLQTESDKALAELQTARDVFTSYLEQLTENNQSAHQILDAVNSRSPSTKRYIPQLYEAKTQLNTIRDATIFSKMDDSVQEQSDNVTRLQAEVENMVREIRTIREKVLSLSRQLQDLQSQQEEARKAEEETLMYKNQSLTINARLHEDLYWAQEVGANASLTWHSSLDLVQQVTDVISGNATSHISAQLLPLPEGVINWQTGAASLRNQLNATKTALDATVFAVTAANNNAESLSMTSNLINQTFQSVKYRGENAVGAIQDFRVAIETLNSSMHLAREAAATIDQVQANLTNATVQNLEAVSTRLKSSSETFRDELNSLNYEAEVLQLSVNSVQTRVTRTKSDWSTVQGRLGNLSSLASTLNTTLANSTLTHQIATASSRINQAQTALEAVTSYVATQQQTLDRRDNETSELQRKANETVSLTASVEISLNTYYNILNNLTQQTNDAKRYSTTTSTIRQRIEDKISSIEEKLLQAQNILNTLRQPVHLDVTTGVSLTNPVANSNEVYNDLTFDFRRDVQVKNGNLFFSENPSSSAKLEVRLDNGKVVFEYNTNVEPVIIISPADICEGCWAHVLASRYKNTGYLTVSLLSTGGSVTRSYRGLSSAYLLQLNSPFYLGSLPTNYTTSKVANRTFQGCMKDVRYNDVDLDLYHSSLITVPEIKCCKAPLLPVEEPTVTGASFSGFGYLLLQADSTLDVTKNSTFSFQFRTFQSNAALLSLQKPGSSTIYRIYLEDGYIVFQFGANSVLNTQKSARQYMEGRWIEVTVSHNATGMRLDVGYVDVTNATLDTGSRSTVSVDLTALSNADVIIGIERHPNDVPPGLNETSFAGCLRNLQYSVDPSSPPMNLTLNKNVVSSMGIEFNGCPQTVVFGLSFLTISAFAQLAPGDNLQQLTLIQFDLLTSHPQGILLYIASPVSQLREIYLGLFHGNLILYYKQTTSSTVTTTAHYLSDRKSHTIRMDFTQYRAVLTVDSNTYEDMSRLTPLPQPYFAFTTSSQLFIGGVPEGTVLRPEFPARRSLIGGIKNFFINGVNSEQRINFLSSNAILSHRDISLSGIASPPSTSPPLPYSTSAPTTSAPPPVCSVLQNPSRLATTEGVYMDGSNPFAWNADEPRDIRIATILGGSFVLSMTLQAYKADGILAYAPDRFVSPTQYMFVYMLNGYIHLDLLTSTGQVQSIHSIYRYNDAMVYKVDILRINDFAAIIVPETKDYVNSNKNSSLTSSLLLHDTNEVFLGGITSVVDVATGPFPEVFKNESEKMNFAGALFKVVLGDDVTSSTISWQLLDRVKYPQIYSQVRYGVSLSGTNSFLLIPTKQLIPTTTRSYEIKLTLVMTSPEALLLMLYETYSNQESQYLVLYYRNGQLAVHITSISTGSQPFIFTFPYSKPLCDGQSHILKLEVSVSEVVLQVDGALADDKPFPPFFLPPEFSAAAEIFVGGLRDLNMTFTEPVVQSSMKGCLQSVTFDPQPGDSFPATQLDPTQYTANGHGFLYGCPY